MIASTSKPQKHKRHPSVVVINKNVNWLEHPAAWAWYIGMIVLGWLLLCAVIEDSGLAWSFAHLIHGVITYYLLHWTKGTPFAEDDQGKYSRLTFWEQASHVFAKLNLPSSLGLMLALSLHPLSRHYANVLAPMLPCICPFTYFHPCIIIPDQVDQGSYATRNRKLFTAMPVILFLLATNGTDFRKQPLGLNLVVVLVCVIAKLPALDRVRVFGINKY